MRGRRRGVHLRVVELEGVHARITRVPFRWYYNVPSGSLWFLKIKEGLEWK